MPKRRHSKRTHPASPESLDFTRDGEFIEPFIEGPKKPEYKPEKEERKYARVHIGRVIQHTQ